METPDVAMACARAVLLPADLAVQSKRSMVSNVTRAIQGNLIVSVLLYYHVLLSSIYARL